MRHGLPQQLAVAACLLAASCSGDTSPVAPTESAPDQSIHSGQSADPNAELQGQWTGAWGGGESGDGVVFQPVIAELVIDGDKVQLSGFPDVNDVTGTIQVDADVQKVIVTPDAEDGEDVELTYRLAGDELTLTGTDGRTVSLTRKQPQVEATESDEVPLP